MFQVMDIVQPLQRGSGVEDAEKIDITKTDAALTGKVRPVVASGVIIQRHHLFGGQPMPQHDVGGASLGNKPIPLLVARFGKIDKGQLVSRQRVHRFVEVHFMPQNHVASKGDRLPHRRRLRQGALQQLFLRPGVADRLWHNA